MSFNSIKVDKGKGGRRKWIQKCLMLLLVNPVRKLICLISECFVRFRKIGGYYLIMSCNASESFF